MKPNDAAIRKRTQIAKANRTMFLWIAIASALVGAAVVVSIVLFQELVYKEKVLAAKQDTVNTLSHNNEVVSELESKIRVLDTDPALGSVKANADDQSIQVILDALPSDANSLALGASLQNKLLNGIPSLSIISMQVDPVVGVEVITDDGETAPVQEEVTEDVSSNVISFQFVVTGETNALKQALQNLERSIRTIKINKITIESQSGLPTMTVQAHAYFEPAKQIELKDEAVKR